MQSHLRIKLILLCKCKIDEKHTQNMSSYIYFSIDNVYKSDCIKLYPIWCRNVCNTYCKWIYIFKSYFPCFRIFSDAFYVKYIFIWKSCIIWIRGSPELVSLTWIFMHNLLSIKTRFGEKLFHSVPHSVLC